MSDCLSFIHYCTIHPIAMKLWKLLSTLPWKFLNYYKQNRTKTFFFVYFLFLIEYLTSTIYLRIALDFGTYCDFYQSVVFPPRIIEVPYTNVGKHKKGFFKIQPLKRWKGGSKFQYLSTQRLRVNYWIYTLEILHRRSL